MHLSKLLRSVVAHPEVSITWLAIREWRGLVLFLPTRGGKRHNFASTVKKRVSDFSLKDCSTARHASDGSFKTHTKSPTPLLAQAVAA